MSYHNFFSKPLTINYRGRLCSEAAIFYLIINLIRFLLPLIIVWQTDSFWIKEATFREMPDVDFKKQFIFLVETANDEPIRGFSTFPLIDQAFRRGGQWLPVIIAEYQSDNNHDSKYDQLDLKLTIPMPIIEFRLILFFWYRIDHRLQMESLADIWYHHSKPGTKAWIEGDLQLIQRKPLKPFGYEFRYNKTMVPQPANQTEEEFSENPFFIDEMLRQYFSRDYFTKVLYTYRDWHPYRPVANQSPNESNFELNIRLYYRDQLFQYRTKFWFLVKWALVQYLAVFFALDYFIRMIKSYVFQQYLVASVAHVSDPELIRLTMKKEY